MQGDAFCKKARLGYGPLSYRSILEDTLRTSTLLTLAANHELQRLAHAGRSESQLRAGAAQHYERGGAAAATLAKPVLRYHPLFAVSWQVQTLSKQAER